MQISMRESTKNWSTMLTLLTAILLVGLTATANLTSVFSLAFYYVFFSCINRMTARIRSEKFLLLFNIYGVLMLCLYFSQISLYPSTFGLTSGRGTGADDVLYYGQAVTNLPHGFELDAYTYVSDASMYVRTLRVFAKLFSILYTNHPLDLLFFNVGIMAFLPFCTKKLSNLLYEDCNCANSVFILTATCPLCLSCGLILMRDVLIGLLFICSAILLIKKKYLPFITLFIYMAMIRLGSALVSIPFYAMLWIELEGYRTGSRVLKAVKTFVVVLAIVVSLFLFASNAVPYLNDYLSQKGLGSSIFRSGLLDIYQTSNIDNVSSAYKWISRQNIVIRVPLLSVWYQLSPILSSTVLSPHGIFQPRYIFTKFGFPLMILFTTPCFLNGIVSSLKRKDKLTKAMVIPYIVTLVLLAVSSQQIRHKVMIMPLYYIICSYGKFQRRGMGFAIGVITSTCLLLVEIYTSVM